MTPLYRRRGPWTKPRPQLDLFADHMTLFNWHVTQIYNTLDRLEDARRLPAALMTAEERETMVLAALDWS